MRTLVASGPGMLYLECEDAEKVISFLENAFHDTEITHKPIVDYPDSIGCLVFVMPKSGAHTMLAFKKRHVDILSAIINSHLNDEIIKVVPLPPMILFNALGDVQAIVETMARELNGKRIRLPETVKNPDDHKVFIAFLIDNETLQARSYEFFLEVEEDPLFLRNYLRIHAARFLASAFPADTWHMVDLHIYDRYEAYDLQYKRLLEGIEGLDLGYVVTEIWDRETRTFGDPVELFHVKMLTFLTPLELKKRLIGLEYTVGRERIVNLDLYYHNKKITWQNVLDDKETRKAVKGERMTLPTSAFFTYQNERKQLIEYCMELIQSTIREENKRKLMAYTKEIQSLFWN